MSDRKSKTGKRNTTPAVPTSVERDDGGYVYTRVVLDPFKPEGIEVTVDSPVYTFSLDAAAARGLAQMLEHGATVLEVAEKFAACEFGEVSR